jgi:cellulose synthase/poly-beta-1,6-N-acetylglucosamine synthase-like glycosyltransferase
LNHTKGHRFSVSELEKISPTKRDLIKKKFVDWKILGAVFVLSFAYMLLNNSKLTTTHWLLVILLDIVLFLLVWNKLYQVLYDLKLLFFFDEKYDVDATFPAGKEYPVIAFIIPSYHEPFKVAKMTIDSVVNAPYSGRKEIIVVDNSKNTTSEDFLNLKKYIEEFNSRNPLKNINAKFIYNHRRDTLKPGNLDLAEKHIDEAEFVVILDVDSTLPSKGRLLESAVTEFILDHKLGFLQFTLKATNHHFNDLTQAVAASQDLHRLRLTSRSYGGYKIFEGHNGMWRKTVLDKVGAWTDYYKGNIMITEDILKSAQVYSNGYYGKSLNIKTGEWVPSSLNALESMWMRWTYGTSQVLFKYFMDIYSKRVSLVEKFDITYHVLHHFAHGFIIPLAILLQLTVPGMLTSLFIGTAYVLPQLVGAITIYFKSVRKLDLPLAAKLKYVYYGCFLVDTFIISTQLRSSINFLVGIPQGWKVTAKGIEDSLAWKDLLLNKTFHIFIGALCLLACGISWYLQPGSSPLHSAGLIFLVINLVLCIFLFGKEGRKECNDVESAFIDTGDQEILENEVLVAIDKEQSFEIDRPGAKISDYMLH